MMDWAQPLIIARRELRYAEELLSRAPYGDADRRHLAEIGAADHVERAMVQLAKILGSVQA